MMRKRFLQLSLYLCFLSACSTKTTVQVVRHPLIQFNSGAATWTETSYFFLRPFQIVSYPADTTLPGRLYDRFTLQAIGRDTKGENLQLTLVFDAVDSADLTGPYSPAYSSIKGLAQVQLFNLDNNNLSYYSLCSNDSSSVLQIQRQSVTENLVSGSFQFTLCNARDTSQKIAITNGIFTDIHY